MGTRLQKARFWFLTDQYATHIILAIATAGVVLRVAGITASAIWFDEAIPLFAARLPFFEMMHATQYTFSPPLWGILTWLIVHVLGDNELLIRLPPLIASILAIWLVYQLTLDFGLSTSRQIVVMLFVALFPYQLWAAQDGRVYALLATLYLGAIWFALHNRWLGLTACAGLLLYAHFTGAFYLAALYLVALINNGLNWKNLKNVLISGAIVSLGFLPWLPTLSFSLQSNGGVPSLSLLYFLNVAYEALFLNAVRTSSPGIALLGMGMILISVTLALLLGCARLAREARNLEDIANRRYLQLTIFAMVPPVALLLLSLGPRDLLYYRMLTAMLTPAIIWVVQTLAQGLRHWIPKTLIVTFWMSLLGFALITWSPAAKGDELRTEINLIRTQWQAGDVIYHITGTTYLPFAYYLADKPAYLLDEQRDDWLLPRQLEEIYGLTNVPLETLSYKRVWVVYARDSLLSKQANQRAKAYIQGGTLVGRTNIWAYAPIEVYLVTKETP